MVEQSVSAWLSNNCEDWRQVNNQIYHVKMLQRKIKTCFYSYFRMDEFCSALFYICSNVRLSLYFFRSVMAIRHSIIFFWVEIRIEWKFWTECPLIYTLIHTQLIIFFSLGTNKPPCIFLCYTLCLKNIKSIHIYHVISK